MISLGSLLRIEYKDNYYTGSHTHQFIPIVGGTTARISVPIGSVALVIGRTGYSYLLVVDGKIASENVSHVDGHWRIISE